MDCDDTARREHQDDDLPVTRYADETAPLFECHLRPDAKEIAPERVYEFKKLTPAQEKEMFEQTNCPPMEKAVKNDLPDTADFNAMFKRYLADSEEDAKRRREAYLIEEDRRNKELKKLVVLYLSQDCAGLETLEGFKSMMSRLPRGWDWTTVLTNGPSRAEVISFQ